MKIGLVNVSSRIVDSRAPSNGMYDYGKSNILLFSNKLVVQHLNCDICLLSEMMVSFESVAPEPTGYMKD